MAKLEFKLGIVKATPSALHRVSNARTVAQAQLVQLNGDAPFRLSNCDCGKEKEKLENEGAAVDPSQPAGPSPSDVANKDYPWDKCIADNEGKHGAESAKKICGSIKAKFGNCGCSEKIKNELDAAFGALENGATVDDVLANIGKPKWDPDFEDDDIDVDARMANNSFLRFVSNAGNSEGARKGWDTKKGEGGIENPNSSGQGFHSGHKTHALHETITKHGYAYSHSTPIHMQDGSLYVSHTYKHSNPALKDNAVSVNEDHNHQSEWSVGVVGSGSHYTGKGGAALDKFLKGHVARATKKASTTSNSADIYQRAHELLANGGVLPPDVQAELDAAYKRDFVSNAGTSEGVRKSWETRKGGYSQPFTHGFLSLDQDGTAHLKPFKSKTEAEMEHSLARTLTGPNRIAILKMHPEDTHESLMEKIKKAWPDAYSVKVHDDNVEIPLAAMRDKVANAGTSEGVMKSWETRKGYNTGATAPFNHTRAGVVKSWEKRHAHTVAPTAIAYEDMPGSVTYIGTPGKMVIETQHVARGRTFNIGIFAHDHTRFGRLYSAVSDAPNSSRSAVAYKTIQDAESAIKHQIETAQ